MSKDCLVTKLKGSVNNDSLHRYGEIFFNTYHSDSAVSTSNCISIKKYNISDTIKARVVSGSGNLTDSDLVSNPVKQKTYNSGSEYEHIYFSNNDMVIAITCKYKTSTLYITDPTNGVNWGFDTKELAYGGFNTVGIQNTVLNGDIAEIKKWFNDTDNDKRMLYYPNNDARGFVYGNLNSLDGFWLGGFTTIPRFGSTSSISGDVHFDIQGDIVSYVNSNIDYTDAASNYFYNLNWLKYTKVTGNLSQLDSKAAFFSSTGNHNIFTWTPGSSRTQILCVETVTFADGGIKNYLIDNADLPLSSIAGLPKIITLLGTVDLTDADVITAINKLKTKGLTAFTINGHNMLA